MLLVDLEALRVSVGDEVLLPRLETDVEVGLVQVRLPDGVREDAVRVDLEREVLPAGRHVLGRLQENLFISCPPKYSGVAFKKSSALSCATVDGKPPSPRKTSMLSSELFNQRRNAAASAGFFDCLMTDCALPPFSAVVGDPS